MPSHVVMTGFASASGAGTGSREIDFRPFRAEHFVGPDARQDEKFERIGCNALFLILP